VNPTRLQRFSRWGLLAVPLVLGLVLIGSSVHGYLGAQRLVDDVTRGQAEGFARDILEASRPTQGPPTQEHLATVVSMRHAWGLRYAAMVDAHGVVIAEAGESLEGGRSLPHPGRLQRVANRVRWLVPPPPPPPGLGPPGTGPPDLGPPPFGQHPPPPNDAAHRKHPGGPALVVEFEPMSAVALIDRSRANVLLNVVAAIALMVVASVLWRASARAQQAEADLARQRHLAALGELSAVLAHEIRNPLATVKGHAQLIAERVESDEVSNRWAEVMVKHVVRLERLVHQLLDFSRTAEIRRAAVNPATLVDEAGCELDRDRIDLDTERAPQTWQLDAERMSQVLVNVMQNALQSTPEPGHVQVVVDKEASQLVITIRDHGEGIPTGEEQRIFEPFFTKRVRGTGLGLAVAKRIVELHGGRVDAANHPEGGAVFRIAVPQG
jgi:two-component system sensor histidine kinase HydH